MQEEKASSLGWAGPWALCSAAFPGSVFWGCGCDTSLHISLDYYSTDNTCIQFSPFKQALNGTCRVFPHQPITHVASSWHTQPACLLKKNIHTPMQIQAGFFHYHVSVSHCKPSRNSNLFWHYWFDTSILQLVDMRQLELDMPLPKSEESLWPTMFSLAFWQRFWNYCWPVRACISKWCA